MFYTAKIFSLGTISEERNIFFTLKATKELEHKQTLLKLGVWGPDFSRCGKLEISISLFTFKMMYQALLTMFILLMLNLSPFPLGNAEFLSNYHKF